MFLEVGLRNFLEKSWSPDDFRPALTTKDLCLLKLHGKLKGKDYGQIWDTILEYFARFQLPNRDAVITSLWDELAKKFGEIDSSDDYIRCLEVQCKQCVPQLQGKVRGLKRTLSEASQNSEGSQDPSWMLKLGIEGLEADDSLENMEKKDKDARDPVSRSFL